METKNFTNDEKNKDMGKSACSEDKKEKASSESLDKGICIETIEISFYNKVWDVKNGYTITFD